MTAIPDDVKITPWLEQYRSFKEQYPDALLLFRMGDFYELFFDDARAAAAALDIALTARDQEKKIPMAGVPHHALGLYLGRLIRAGYRAAICEQIGDPSAKGIVERRVTRVVTPGTYVPEEGEGARLAAVLPLKGGRIALALLTVDTGRLEAGTLSDSAAASTLSAFAPGETLYPSNIPERKLPGCLQGLSLRPVPVFRADNAAPRLASALGDKPVASFGIDEGDPCVGAAWAVLDYLSTTQFSTVRHVLQILPLFPDRRMALDAAALRNLELAPEAASVEGASLLSCLDRCRTPMGRRTLRDWLLRPLMDVEAIARRQDAIEALMEAGGETARLRDLLSGTRDVERALSRLSLGTGGPRDLTNLRNTLRLLPELRALPLGGPLAGLLSMLPDLSELLELLEDALEETPARALGAGPVIRSSHNGELAQWREMGERGEEWLAAYLERERAACRTSRLRAGHNRAFGYYLEVGKGGLVVTPPHFEPRQTLVNADRYTTAELRDFQDRMERAGAEAERVEAELYRDLVERTVAQGEAIQSLGRLLGILDCAASGAAVARERGYVRPLVDTALRTEIRAGRHPVLETTSPSGFVPNDVLVGGENARVVILTGPNMAGKSTWLRMTALLCVMAQAGLWVPAESARLGLVDRVFTRIGARDDLTRGSSTFMVEMLETAAILNNVTDRSLVILDEVGRGTATWDGMSIAWAVLERLAGTGARVLFATHYHELTCLEGRLEGVANLSMAVAEGEDGIRFLHQVMEGPADRSYGIEVARLAGLPGPVLRRAFELLEAFEREGRTNAPEPPPQQALRRQLTLFSPAADAVVEELARMDLEEMSPARALSTLKRLRQRALRALES